MPATQATPPAFDPYQWAKRYRDNMQTTRRNSLMDPGWSATIADQCQATSFQLFDELMTQLRKVKIQPEDFFDRPELAAALAAAHESKSH